MLRYLEEATSPFFLWIHYWDPHDTAIGPPGGYSATREQRAHVAAASNEVERRGRAMRIQYEAEVRYMDSQIGRVLDALRSRRGGDDTVIAVISDHGEGLLDHAWWSHRILYQEQIRVPLILQVPGPKPRSAVPELVRSIDVMPTILDYLGMEPPAGISGRSLRGLMEGDSEEKRIAIADQVNGYDLAASMLSSRPLDDFLYVAMDADAKLIYRPAHPELSELYELRDDPAEERNVYASRPYHVLRLKEALAREAPWVTEPFTASSRGGMSEEAREALATLGYVEPAEEGDGTRADAHVWVWTCPARPDYVVSESEDRGTCPTPLIPIRPRTDEEER